MLRKCIVRSVLRSLVSRSVTISSRSLATATATCPVTSEVDWSQARPYTEIPGPSKLQLVRGFLPGGQFHKQPINYFFTALRERYGDFFMMPGLFGKKDIILSLNPDIYRRVFRNEGQWPMRRNFEAALYFRNVYRKDFFKGVEGLIMTSGETWGDFRTAVNPILMQPKNAREYLKKMIPVNNEFLQRIRDIRDPNTLEMPDSFEDEINRLTFESVAVIALDQQLGLIRRTRDIPEAEQLFKSIRESIDIGFEIYILPSIWKIVKTPKFHRLMRMYDDICNITGKYIEESLTRIEQNSHSKDDNEQRGVLEKLAQKDKLIAVVMAMDMLMAGVDTTTSSLTGILLSIATNPEKQERLRQEIAPKLPQKNSVPTLENMKNMPYLRACIKEGIRLYPIGPGALRTMQKDIVINGYQIPEGTDIAMGNNINLRDPKYFVKPNDFIPERWLRTEEGGLYKPAEVNPFVYLPFGFGPRSCVGKRIVDLELELTLMRLVRNFYIEFNYPTENAFKTKFLPRPNIPLKFKFTEAEK